VPAKRQFDRYEIRDSKLFQALLIRLEESHGSGAKAAEAVEISQSSFSRLRRLGPEGTVTNSQMARLAKALVKVPTRSRETPLNEQLARCVMGTAGTLLWRRAYSPWLKERFERFARRRGIRWQRTMETPPRIYPAGTGWRLKGRDQLLRTLISQMADDCPHEWKVGEAALRSSGVSRRRVQVALVRIAEPFAEYAESGYIERMWRDLKNSEKRAYVRRAFDQERLLMPQPNDQDCARAVVEQARIEWRTAK
jgi:hypothetical protein